MIPCHTIVLGYYGFMLDISVSVRPSICHLSVFHFRNITSKYQWIFSKLGMCIDIVEIGFELFMGKFCQFLTELSARHTSVFLFPGNNLRKCQQIFAKLGMCFDIVEMWFGIANGQISSIFDRVICPKHVCTCIFVSRR